MDIEKVWADHRPAVVAACRRVLRSEADVQEAVSETYLEVVEVPEREAPTNWRAWLCQVAVNKATDILRKKKREAELRKKLLREVAPSRVRRVDLRMGPLELCDRISEFVRPDKRANFALFCAVELGVVTRKQLAAERGLSGEALNARLRRARGAARDAAVAVCLVDDRGPGRCDDVRQRFAGRKGSADLLGEIKAHAATCDLCREKWRHPTWLLRSVLVVGGAVTGLLAWLGRVGPGKKVAVTGAAAATTAVVVALFAEGVDTARLAPVPVPYVIDSTAPAPAYPPAGSLPPPGPPSRTSEPPAPPADQPPPAEQPPPGTSSTRTTPSAPTTTTGTPTSTSDGERDAGPPAVDNGWIEYPKIFIARRGTCGDKPATSAVTATITAPAGVRTATVLLGRHGQDVVSFLMTNVPGTSEWHTEIRGLDGWYGHGRYRVLVEVVGADGRRWVTKIGSVCVSRCGARPPGRGNGT